MKFYQILILSIFVVMTIAGLLSMYSDKKRAIKHKQRIKESILFAIAILLGGVGSTIGMYAFRHKTKHWYFVVFMPVFAITSIAITVYLAFIL